MQVTHLLLGSVTTDPHRSRLLSWLLNLQLIFHVSYNHHLHQIIASALPPLLPSWTLQWPSLLSWVSEETCMKEASIPVAEALNSDSNQNKSEI